MATFVVFAQALPVTVTKRQPTKSAPQLDPLSRPHGYTPARRLSSLAFNPAMDSYTDGMRVPVAQFVRPDVPPAEGDARKAALRSAWPRHQGEASKARSEPQFRSALEQVSFMTNNKLWTDDEAKPARSGVLGFLGL